LLCGGGLTVPDMPGKPLNGDHKSRFKLMALSQAINNPKIGGKHALVQTAFT